jgi:hypothetical protein
MHCRNSPCYFGSTTQIKATVSFSVWWWCSATMFGRFQFESRPAIQDYLLSWDFKWGFPAFPGECGNINQEFYKDIQLLFMWITKNNSLKYNIFYTWFVVQHLFCQTDSILLLFTESTMIINLTAKRLINFSECWVCSLTSLPASIFVTLNLYFVVHFLLSYPIK